VNPRKPINPSEPFDLAQLVMHLRASGFHTGTRQYLTANQLLLELAAQGKHLYDIADETALEELISYLRPIFCQSPEEQARFEEVLKEWLQYKPRKPSRQKIVRKYANPERWLPLWSKLGRMIVGLVLVFLAIFMIQYWFLPIMIEGFITREDPATGKQIPAPEANVSFKGQPLKLDDTGGFDLRFTRISSPGQLIVTLQDYIEDKRIIDINQPSPIQIALKFDRKKLIIPDSQERIHISAPVVLRLPRGPVGRTEKTNWLLAASVSVAAGIASYLFLLVADRLRRRLVLKRLPAEKRPDLLKLAVASQWPEAFTGQQLRRLVGGLRRPREQDVLEMDATQTAQASARAAGVFSPVMVHRKQMPEYVVLINRKSADDHQAKIFYSLMEQLQQYDVSLVCYYFRNDPRVCWRSDNPLHRLLLSELAVIHHASTLFLCSESALCFDPISGKPESWVKKIEEWPNRVLFTPDPPYHWTRREWSLTAAGMIILPATATGLKIYAELSEDWRIEMLFPAEYSRAYPAIIGSDSMRWIDRKAPPPETIKRLLRQLSGYLGPTAFVWLCACAIYPEISLPLTQYLFGAISKISGSDGRPDLQLKSLSFLARLPWFRYGYMPDWLRVTLINQLTVEQETAVRRHLEALLKRIAERKISIRGKEGLHVAAWVEPKDILQTAPPGSPMGDGVFLGFMSGANLDRLVVEAPRRFGRWFQRLKRLPESEIPKAPRSLAQRLMIWFKSQMTFHRNLVRGSVSAVLSVLVLLAVVQLLPKKIPFEEDRPKTIESVAFPQDGQILASAGLDQFIKLWDASVGTELATFKGDPMWIKSIAFSPDGKTLASGGADQTIRLWDVETGNEIKRIRGHTGMIFSVAFSPDGKSLASASADKSIKIWNVAIGNLMVDLKGYLAENYSVAYSPDGQRLASGGADRAIRLWDVSTGNPIVIYAGHTDSVFSVAFSPDGQRLASASADKTVKLWDVVTGAEMLTYAGHTDSVFSVAFSPDGQILASGGGEGRIIFWDVATGQKLREIIGGTENVYQLPLALNLTGNKLAAGISNAISLWPIQIKSLEKGARLYVETLPKNATVRFLNIKAEFSQGMELDPGLYHMEVSADGYETQRRWIDLADGQDEPFRFELAQTPSKQLTGGDTATPPTRTEIVQKRLELPLEKNQIRPAAPDKEDPPARQFIAEEVQTGRLYVETVPENARVRIMNIKPKFYPGIELEPGRYQVEVSAEGYEPVMEILELRGGDNRFNIILRRSDGEQSSSYFPGTGKGNGISTTSDVERLIKMLDNPNKKFQYNAALQLGDYGRQAVAAVPKLRQKLMEFIAEPSYENLATARAATQSLGRIGYADSQTIELLTILREWAMKEDRQLYQVATEALRSLYGGKADAPSKKKSLK
jgi:WD40 repeat protein